MAANLRRGNLPTESTMARFMYYIIKQLDVRGVDWSQVAADMDITNGHAARMRYARYKNQVEGVQPRPREPRAPGAAKDKKGPGRPVKKQKTEKKEEGDGIKKDPNAPTAKSASLGKVESEGSIEGRLGKDGEGEPEMAQAKMRLGPGAGIKREYNGNYGHGDKTPDNLIDPTIRTGSTSVHARSPSRRGSGVRVKNEPADDGSSPKSVNGGGNKMDENGEADAPGESVDPSELSAMTLGQQYASHTPQVSQAQSISAQNSPHTNSSQLHISQAQDRQASLSNANFTMQHLQLTHSQQSPNQRLFSNDMAMEQHSNTTPPLPCPPHQLPSSSDGSQGYARLNVNTYPTPAYFSNPMQSQSPATTSSSAPFSVPPSPVGTGFQQTDMGGFNITSHGGYDISGGIHNGMSSVMMSNQGGFVGMLEDPSFPRTQGQYYGGLNGNAYGGWEEMY